MNIDKSEFTKSFPIICCLCDTKITKITERHNAQPIINGWCCTECNYSKVLPYRINTLLVKYIKPRKKTPATQR